MPVGQAPDHLYIYTVSRTCSQPTWHQVSCEQNKQLHKLQIVVGIYENMCLIVSEASPNIPPNWILMYLKYVCE